MPMNGSEINGTSDGGSGLDAGSSLAIAVVLSVTGDIVTACSLTLNKYVHNRSAERRTRPRASGLFWLAMIGLVLGEVGNFIAFGFASPTVVSPLGAVAVIANAILARVLLREVIHARGLLGILVAIAGSVVVVVFSPPTIEHLPASELVQLLSQVPAMVCLAAVGAAVAALATLAPRYGRRFLLINVMLCSLIGSITVLSSSFVSKFVRDVSNGDHDVLLSPLPYIFLPVMFLGGFLQLIFLDKAMAVFDSTRVVPVYYITFTLGSITSSGVVFRDFWRFDPLEAVFFCLGCLLCFVGVFLVTHQPSKGGAEGGAEGGTFAGSSSLASDDVHDGSRQGGEASASDATPGVLRSHHPPAGSNACTNEVPAAGPRRQVTFALAC